MIIFKDWQTDEMLILKWALYSLLLHTIFVLNIKNQSRAIENEL